MLLPGDFADHASPAHPVCVLHPTDDDAARLARVDAAADRQAQRRSLEGLAIGEAGAWLARAGVPLRDRYTDAQIIARADEQYPGGFTAILSYLGAR
jgi:hypothetical protein